MSSHASLFVKEGGEELTKRQKKKYNEKLKRLRVLVEHTICRVERLRCIAAYAETKERRQGIA